MAIYQTATACIKTQAIDKVLQAKEGLFQQEDSLLDVVKSSKLG